MKHRTFHLITVGIAPGLLAGILISRHGRASETPAPAAAANLAAPAAKSWLARPGVVEPVSESIKVGTASRAGSRPRRNRVEEVLKQLLARSSNSLRGISY